MKLTIKNLTKIYHSETEGSLALSDISIDFPETGFVVVTGESGSGKTTLLNILSGFTDYEEGDYFVDGINFLTYSNSDLEKFRKNDIGFIFQDYRLVEDYTVIDNLIVSLLAIGVPYQEAKKRSQDVLKTFGLEDKETVLTRSLSGGQKQKIAIARAILKEPAIVICDEPTANLDGESGIRMFEILKDFSKDHLVIIATHNYEDAKDYATESIRLYRGKLTAHQSFISQDATSTKNEDHKTNFLPIALTNIKNHIPKTIFKFSFLGIFLSIIIILLTLFSANIDDASTKKLSREVFNNINDNEVLVMRSDLTSIDESELAIFDGGSHITNSQLYGLATEMNYYYREGIDYQYNVVISAIDNGPGREMTEITKLVFEAIQDTLYLKDYHSFVGENDLISGNLPIQYNEVVANSNYKVGDTIKVFFSDFAVHGMYYFPLTFTVSGIYKDSDDDLYFSPEFLKSFDYLQLHTIFTPSFSLTIKYNYQDLKLTDVFDLLPIYNPELKDDEILFSIGFASNRTLIFNEETTITDFFYLADDVKSEQIIYDFKVRNEDLPPRYVYVGKNIFNNFMASYKPSTARIYIETYSYLDEVTSSLNKKGFDCLSAYRAGSIFYDESKQNQRTTILIISLSLIVLIPMVYFIFGYLFEKSNKNTDSTLILLGASPSGLRKASAFSILLTYILSLVFGISLYFILMNTINISFIQNIYTYFRFYHLLIASGITFAVMLLIWWRYICQITKKKGGRK